MQYLFNLGRQSNISIAELYSVYGEQDLEPLNKNFAILESENSLTNLDNLGGSYKVSGQIKKIDLREWSKIAEVLSEFIKENKDINKKLTFGLNFYYKDLKIKDIHKIGFQIKKNLLKDFHSVRYVENRELELNSAQVINNKLLKANNLDINIIFDNNVIWLSKTMFVQNISRYVARDFKRPFRDARNGMLPPKLAQIIINIATKGKLQTVLDPFCGTGVILQEALLMGNNVVGSDLNPKMVDYSEGNIKWLNSRFSLKPNLKKSYLVGDSRSLKWPNFDCVASEASLGAPLAKIPGPDVFQEIIFNANSLIKDFLKNLSTQTKPNDRICIAIPAWKLSNQKFQSLDLIDHLSDLGYNLIKFKGLNSQELIYLRPDQVVGRQLLALTRI